MSLDFYLEDDSNPCPHCGHRGSPIINPVTIFNKNITHNLGPMAKEAGIYTCLWAPEEGPFERAEQLIPRLENALKQFKESPAHFKKFDAPNGWGTLEQFIPWVEQVLEACKHYPRARVRASR